uniref:Uncharacterized protein n=1 Tax=viral metagenome TaxID=1070528 RepID=A0A6M3KMV5_9ZZZZ
MSESLREHAGWRRGKTPVLAKYLDDHGKLFSTIAGRGFLALPGYAYAIENDLELTAKMGLSELNYKILSETIEREMKQIGIDYGLAYKNAVIVWETLKQELLAAWDAELALIRQGMAAKEETLNIYAIEVSKRAIALLEAKTTLEEQAEVYRKAIVELDSSVYQYDIQLANAKLATAQRRLLIIPILEEILLKEQELLVSEGEKAGFYTTYMEAEEEVAIKKQTLIPVINEYAAKVDEYSRKIINVQIPIEGQIADEKVTQAGIAVEKAGYQVAETTTEIEITEKGIDLDAAKRDLEVTQFDNSQEIASTEIDLNRDFQTDEMSQFTSLLQSERMTQAILVDNKRTVHLKDNLTKVASATRIQGATRNADTGINAAEIRQMEGEASAKAATALTATLQHLIG